MVILFNRPSFHCFHCPSFHCFHCTCSPKALALPPLLVPRMRTAYRALSQYQLQNGSFNFDPFLFSAYILFGGGGVTAIKCNKVVHSNKILLISEMHASQTIQHIFKPWNLWFHALRNWCILFSLAWFGGPDWGLFALMHIRAVERARYCAGVSQGGAQTRAEPNSTICVFPNRWPCCLGQGILCCPQSCIPGLCVHPSEGWAEHGGTLCWTSAFRTGPTPSHGWAVKESSLRVWESIG